MCDNIIKILTCEIIVLQNYRNVLYYCVGSRDVYSMRIDIRMTYTHDPGSKPHHHSASISAEWFCQSSLYTEQSIQWSCVTAPQLCKPSPIIHSADYSAIVNNYRRSWVVSWFLSWVGGWQIRLIMWSEHSTRIRGAGQQNDTEIGW